MSFLSQTNKEFFQEKFFSFPLAFFFLLFLSPLGVGDAYLILGHAHFMMTALYQFKMGRVTKVSFVVYLILFALLFSIAYKVPQAFTLFVATALLFHVYFGEARHLKLPFRPVYLFMTLGFAVLLGAWLSMELWGFSINGVIPLLLSGALVLAACFYFFKENGKKFEALFYTLLALYGIFVCLEFLGMRPMGLQSYGFIVIAHYLATYFNVYRSFTRKGQGKQWLFTFESFGMNLLFLAGYIIIFFYVGTDNFVYDYVYHPLSFYVWTLMHFITTMDFAKYKEWAVGALKRPTGA